MQQCSAFRRLDNIGRSYTTSCRLRAQDVKPPPLPQYTKAPPRLQPVTKPSTTPVETSSEQKEAVDLKDARFGARDPARGYQAMMQVAQTGKLDPRYRPAARRVLSIIVALPVVIVLGYVLFQRRFMGKEKKQLPAA